jgi:uncharacterized protein YegL
VKLFHYRRKKVTDKKTNNNLNIMVNHIIFVLDKSGSMGHLRKATVDNMNEQLGQLKINAETNQVNLVSLVTFNSKVERVRDSIPLGNFEEIGLEEYVPAGWTALYDGIGEAIMIADQGFEKYAEMDNSALIVILSDGQENKSVEYNRNTIAPIVKQRQDGGRFTFTFLGCGESVISQATGINIPGGNTQIWAYDSIGLHAGMLANSVGTRSYMSARNKGITAASGFYEPKGECTSITSPPIEIIT